MYFLFRIAIGDINVKSLANNTNIDLEQNGNETGHLTKNDNSREMNSNHLDHGYHFLYDQEQQSTNGGPSKEVVETQPENEGTDEKNDILNDNLETKIDRKDSNYKVFNEDYQDKLMDEIFIV